MKTHDQIDRRSLAMARAVVERIDADPERMGFAHAVAVNRGWLARDASAVNAEWADILARGWEHARRVLLDPGEEGRRLRQSSPFCGVLSPRERWALYRKAANDEAA